MNSVDVHPAGGEAKTDHDLLRAYAEDRSEAAFAELVHRHARLVHAIALRETEDSSLAEEVTQAVFLLLARKADQIKSEVVLAGWLFRAARFAAGDLLKSERRRHIRETEAFRMNADSFNGRTNPADGWRQISEVLDQCMAELGETDRHAILLRFFEGKGLTEVGTALGTTAEAARKRVGRALEKLQTLLVQRGAPSSVMGLGVLLSIHAAPAVPESVTTGALAAALGGPSASGATSTLAESVGRLLWWWKVKPWIAGLCLFTAGGVGLSVARPAWLERYGRPLANSTTDDYRVAGFEDARVVHQFVVELKRAAAAGDRGRIAHLIHFPLRINGGGRTQTLPGPTEFLAAYESLFTPALLAQLEKSPNTGLFCNQEGVMLGAGSIWLAPETGDQAPLRARIIALNL